MAYIDKAFWKVEHFFFWFWDCQKTERSCEAKCELGGGNSNGSLRSLFIFKQMQYFRVLWSNVCYHLADQHWPCFQFVVPQFESQLWTICLVQCSIDNLLGASYVRLFLSSSAKNAASWRMCIMYNKFSPSANCRQVNLPFIWGQSYRSLEEGGREKARQNKRKGSSSFCGSAINTQTRLAKLLLASEMKKKHFSPSALASSALPSTVGHKNPLGWDHPQPRHRHKMETHLKYPQEFAGISPHKFQLCCSCIPSSHKSASVHPIPEQIHLLQLLQVLKPICRKPHRGLFLSSSYYRLSRLI